MKRQFFAAVVLALALVVIGLEAAPVVYFNVGRASRTGVHEFITDDPITPSPTEIVSLDLEVAASELTDPSKSCRMEIYRSLDGVNWVFLAAARFTGHPENTDAPSIGVDGYVLIDHYLKARFIIGNGTTDELNVGFKVHGHPESEN